MPDRRRRSPAADPAPRARRSGNGGLSRPVPNGRRRTASLRASVTAAPSVGGRFLLTLRPPHARDGAGDGPGTVAAGRLPKSGPHGAKCIDLALDGTNAAIATRAAAVLRQERRKAV